MQARLISRVQPTDSSPISHLRAKPKIEDGSQMEEATATLLLETLLETFTCMLPESSQQLAESESLLLLHQTDKSLFFNVLNRIKVK